MSEQIQSNNNLISIEKNVVANNLINTRNVYNDYLFNCEDVVNNISLININITTNVEKYDDDDVYVPTHQMKNK
jgi:hypothetical protein